MILRSFQLAQFVPRRFSHIILSPIAALCFIVGAEITIILLPLLILIVFKNCFFGSSKIDGKFRGPRLRIVERGFVSLCSSSKKIFQRWACFHTTLYAAKVEIKAFSSFSDDHCCEVIDRTSLEIKRKKKESTQPHIWASHQHLMLYRLSTILICAF